MLLENEHIQEVLLGTGWHIKGRTIFKTYKLESFPDAVSFVNSVVSLAEESSNIPEIHLNNERVKITLTSPEEDGVTEKDVDLALAIEEIAE